MAIETINDRESGKAVRDKLNGNFGQSLNLDPTTGLQIGGAAPNEQQRAAVRAGIGATIGASAAGRSSVRKLLIWGDSTAAMNSLQTVNTSRLYLGTAWAQLGVYMSRNRVDVVAVSGNSGYRTDQIAPLFAAQVAAHAPDYVLITAATNDLIQGLGAAYALRGVLQMAALVESIGAVPIVRTISPGGSFAASPELFQARRDFNALIASAALQNGWPLFDTSRAYLDTASAVDAPMSGYTDGEFHPLNKGAVVEAEILADLLKGLPRRELFNPTTTGNLASNPLMTGTGGTKPTGVTGVVPDGGNYNIGGGATCVSSIVPRTDGGYGDWWQSEMVIPVGGYVSQLIGVVSMAAAGIAVGDTLRAVCDIEVLDGHDGGVNSVDLRAKFNGATDPQWATAYSPASASGTLRLGRFAAQYRIPELVVPAGTTSISLYANISGANCALTTRVGAVSAGKVA